MGARSATAWIAGLGCVLALAARAEEPLLRSGFDEISVPAPPEAAVILPVPAARMPARSAVLDLPPPPPAAPVTLPMAEILAGAIESRLADTSLALPARFPKKDREGLAAFYRARGFRPVWIEQSRWTERARATLDQLAGAGEDGLDPVAYAVRGPSDTGPVERPLALAEAELKLAASAYLYARDARGGRIEPARLSALMTPKLELPALADVLGRLAGPESPAAVLAGYQPAYPGYAALKEQLAEIRAHRPTGAVAQLPRGTQRTRTAIAVIDEFDAPALPPVSTVSPARLEGDLVANMERWRWLPATVAPRYVFVNIPEFRLRLVEDGRTLHETRVITGKPETPTPILSGVLDRAVVNPSWHIPPSIMKNEILPGLARDPNYAAKRGYEVVRRGRTISVRQPPGERNALGFVKFLFPNDHAVYLHDTPNRSLFGAGRRAFSHGCVRVENPFRLADALLGSSWDERRLKSLIGRGERTIPMAQGLPVHLAYFTLEAEPGGTLRSFEDIYGFNRRVRVALGLGA